MAKGQKSHRNSALTDFGARLNDEIKIKNRHRREGLHRQSQARGADVSRRNDLLVSLELVNVAIGDLKFGSRRVRKRDPAHIREVAKSIAHFGLVRPILIGRDRDIIDGEITAEAARLNGMTHLPCIFVDHLSDDERRLLRLTLNRLGEKGEWDISELRIEFGELILSGAPIEISGFAPDEMDKVLSPDLAEGLERGPISPEADATPVAKPGDEYWLGDHFVICGDATDPAVLLALMRGRRRAGSRPSRATPSALSGALARIILTDEPYNVAIAGNVTRGGHREFAMASGEMDDDKYLGFNVAWMSSALPYLSNGGILATFIDWRGYHVVDAAARSLGLSNLNLVVWAKDNAGMGSLYRSQHELLPLFKKGGASHVNNIELGKRGRWRSNVWTYPGASSLGSDARRGLTDHPTVKPTSMLEDALLDLTHRGDIVLDPFLGSGSTLIAAQRTARSCRGVEIDPLYVDLIVRRFEAETGVSAILAETGETYEQIAARRAQAPEPKAKSSPARRRGRGKAQ
jgi:DNA modification methylase